MEQDKLVRMEKANYFNIVEHYESCLQRHGDSHLGVDWPNKHDAQTRYQVMLELIPSKIYGEPVRLLDFGCGASHLYEYILHRELNWIAYSGLDLSKEFVQLSRSKFPAVTYYCVDLLNGSAAVPEFDYIVMNGVFTEKRDLSFDEMFDYFRRLVKKVFLHAKSGIAFNVMSKHVDWEREDLFHLPFDMLAAFLRAEITRNFAFRQDYGLHEYTTYAYRSIS